MIFFKHLSVPLALLLSSIGLTSGNAYAVVPDPFASASCLPNGNIVCVKEISSEVDKVITGQYQITNNSGKEIFMFGVTNSNATKAYSTIYNKETKTTMRTVSGGPMPGMTTQVEERTDYINSWQGKTITKDQWNNSDQLFGAYAAKQDMFGISELYRYNGRNLGTFESLFGTEDTSVNIYWHIQGSDANPFNSGTLNGFFFDANIASQFTAFGTDGTVLATSVGASVAAVPEPETYAMFLAGLGLLGFASRRKNA